MLFVVIGGVYLSTLLSLADGLGGGGAGVERRMQMKKRKGMR